MKLLEVSVVVSGIVLFLGLLFGVWYGASWMEARAFNKITGKHVSAWDAMWVELRVQEQSAAAK